MTGLLTVAQAAGLLGCSEKTVRRAIADHGLRASRVADRGCWVIRVEDLDAWLDARANRPREIVPVSSPPAELGQRLDRPARRHGAGRLAAPKRAA